MKRLTRGELARAGGVNLETIRYYERVGLLPKPPRSSSGYRQYSSDDVRRLSFIKRAQEIGFSLKEVKELLALRVDPNGTSASVRRRAEAKIADIDEKIKSLRAMKRTLARLTAACSGEGSITECSILESLDSKRRR